MKLILNINNEIVATSTVAEYAHIEGIGVDAHWAVCDEQTARNDYANKGFEGDIVKDGGIIVTNKNIVMPFASGVDRIVEAEIPEGINVLEYKYIDGEFVINAIVRANNIKHELETLDTTINRATEDLYVATGTAAYANVQEVIDRKNALRAELASLEA